MTWTIDSAHSQLGFSVRHMGLATVRGRFTTFGGEVAIDDAGEPATVAVEIDAASITTDSADRDAHLRSGDFFDAEGHPRITFRSTALRRVGGEHYELHGDLTMRGVTRPVVLETEIGEPIIDPFGQRRSAAVAHGRINRKEWGLTWNQVLEAGSLLVGEEVTISIDVQVTAAGAERAEAVPA
jgi:polyisoprenoid-binding protein YceI